MSNHPQVPLSFKRACACFYNAERLTISIFKLPKTIPDLINGDPSTSPDDLPYVEIQLVGQLNRALDIMYAKDAVIDYIHGQSYYKPDHSYLVMASDANSFIYPAISDVEASNDN